MASKLNLLIEQGTTFSQEIQLTDDNDDPLVIANTTTAEAEMAKHSSSSNVVIFNTSISNGSLIISLPHHRTANIAPGDYIWNCKLITQNEAVYDPEPSGSSPHTAGGRMTYTRNAAVFANCAVNTASIFAETNGGFNGYYMWFYATDVNGTPTTGSWGGPFTVSLSAKAAGRKFFILDIVANVNTHARSFRINLETGTIESVNSTISQILSIGHQNKGKIISTSMIPTYSRGFGSWENDMDCSQEWVFTANLAGTVAVTSSSNVIVGTGTTFETDFIEGDWIAVWSNSTNYAELFITNIANNTYLEVDTNVGFSNTAAKYREEYLANWWDIEITMDFELPDNHAITQYYWMCGDDGTWPHIGNSGLGIHMTDPVLTQKGTVTRLVEGMVTVTADV